METIDPTKAARVWQRVQGTGQNREQGLGELIAGEWADGAVFLQLSRRTTGKKSNRLRQLAESCQSHAACLKGIYTLLTGERPQIQTVPLPKEKMDITLRRCYGRQMRCLAAYEARSNDPEYGPVFARLADRERDNCRTLLELMGTP